MTVKEYLELDCDNDIDLIRKYNRELVQKYPWCIPPGRWAPLYVSPQDINPDYDYEWTMLDDIPNGWRIAFVDRMCDEIQEEYLKLTDEQKDVFYIIQAKEKFGGLRLYMSFYVDSIEEIIEKYSRLSEITCVSCGKPAAYISKGWICPWCGNCINKENPNGYVDIEKWFNGEDADE